MYITGSKADDALVGATQNNFRTGLDGADKIGGGAADKAPVRGSLFGEAVMKSKMLAACAAVAGLLFGVGFATDAHAQATRTWVSGVGDDANACSRTAPCKTFTVAMSKTAAGGVIDALDAGDFGIVAITKSITIRGTGTGASILASGTNGVNINAPGAHVNLIDLNIDSPLAPQPGANQPPTPGYVGVNVLEAAQVIISNCRITGFRNGAGTGVALSSDKATRVLLKDTLIANNLIGVDVYPAAPQTQVNAATLERVTLQDNPTANIRGNGAKAGIIIRGITALNSPIALSMGAVLASYGDNALSGGAPTATIPLQ